MKTKKLKYSTRVRKAKKPTTIMNLIISDDLINNIMNYSEKTTKKYTYCYTK